MFALGQETEDCGWCVRVVPSYTATHVPACRCTADCGHLDCDAAGPRVSYRTANGKPALPPVPMFRVKLW